MWCQCSQEFHNGILLSPSWSPHYTGWSYWLGIRKRHIMGLSFKTLMGFKDWANNMFKTEEHIISIKKDGLVGEGEPIMHSWRHCNTFLWRLKEYIKFHATIFSKKSLVTLPFFMPNQLDHPVYPDGLNKRDIKLFSKLDTTKH